MKKSGASVFWTGARLGIPVILGYIPVGIAYALIARQAGFSVLETCMMSVFVYAGASEMMAAGNTLLSRFLDSGWALIASTLAGAAAGVFFVELPKEEDADAD